MEPRRVANQIPPMTGEERALLLEIADARTPCKEDPLLWTDPLSEDERQAAIALCDVCVVGEQCAELAWRWKPREVVQAGAVWDEKGQPRSRVNEKARRSRVRAA